MVEGVAAARAGAERVLFVVDRRFLARQAIQKGFGLISPTYNSTWITTGNLKANKNKDIHVAVIDTLDLIYDRIPSQFLRPADRGRVPPVDHEGPEADLRPLPVPADRADGDATDGGAERGRGGVAERT